MNANGSSGTHSAERAGRLSSIPGDTGSRLVRHARLTAGIGHRVGVAIPNRAELAKQGRRVAARVSRGAYDSTLQYVSIRLGSEIQITAGYREGRAGCAWFGACGDCALPNGKARRAPRHQQQGDGKPCPEGKCDARHDFSPTIAPLSLERSRIFSMCRPFMTGAGGQQDSDMPSATRLELVRESAKERFPRAVPVFSNRLLAYANRSVTDSGAEARACTTAGSNGPCDRFFQGGF